MLNSGKWRYAFWAGILFAVGAAPVWASTGVGAGHGVAKTLFLVAVILLFAKGSSLIERWRQPAVLGELVIGVVLGNLALVGLHFFDAIAGNEIINFLAEWGVILLLFQIGLESDIGRMRRVGARALLVAVVGVIVPFVLGTYAVGPWLLPGLSFNAYLFLGATLTATSVGITARVFKDLGKLQTAEAQIVLGAAVIDDVLGLIILAVVSAVATVGTISAGAIAWIFIKALLFLVGAIVIGQLLAPRIGRWLSKVHTGMGMKLTLAVAFAFVFAYVAELFGLAPIVGAFAGGLVLDPVHFKTFDNPDERVDQLIEPIAHLLVPVFFVVTGMNVKLETLFDWPVLLVALGITAAAIVGKIAAGAAAGPVDKLLVGYGMMPRGEVGLIFATIGKSLGVVSDEVFSVIVIVVILTTLVTPPLLAWRLRRPA